MRELEIQKMMITSGPTAQSENALPSPPSPLGSCAASAQVASASPPSALSPPAFDACKHIALVPPFKEAEVDTYFGVFKRIATALNWPREVWSLLLQCKLMGKAQEVCSSLPLQDGLQYDLVKAAILCPYEYI